MVDPLLPTALAWDDWRDALGAQLGPQPVGVVAFVGGQAADWAGCLDQHAGAVCSALSNQSLCVAV